MCDVDSVAVDSAKENFKLNNEKFRDIWVGSINQTKKKYDVILANLTADILKALSREIKSRVKDGGVLILSGVLDKKEFIVTSAFSDANLTQLKRVKKDDWITLVYKRGSNGKYG
jgi:ribosomal protein L11 methyltransferase